MKIKYKKIYLSIFLLFSLNANNGFAKEKLSIDGYIEELRFSTEQYNLAENLTKSFEDFDKVAKNLKNKIEKEKNERDKIKKDDKLKENYKSVDSANKKIKNREKIVDVKPNKNINYNLVSSSIIPEHVKNNLHATTCWDSAGKHYGIDPWLLYSIAYVESGFDPNAIGRNKNGTKDLGLMQINDRVWLPKLSKMGITKNMLKDPCMSVYVGAWILKQNIVRFGYTKKAIGAYNSITPHHNKKYSDKVYLAYAKLTKLHRIKKAQ